MRLEQESGKTVYEPDDKAIEQALKSLDGEKNGFVVLDLEQPGNFFMQVAGGPENFIVEYRDGDQHYRCADEQLDLPNVVRLFTSYAHSEESWLHEVKWIDVTGEFGIKKGCIGGLLLLLVGVGVVLAISYCAPMWLPA